MRICFFANLSAHANWREIFQRVEFYKVDIQLLRDLGHEVIEAGKPSLIDWKADLYYGWWWGHAPFIMLPAKLRRKPIILTGAFDYATCRDELPGLCYLDRPSWQKAVIYSMLQLADRNLFISQFEYDEVTANLRVPRALPVPLAIDTAYYCPLPGQRPSRYFFTVALQSRVNAVRKGLPQTIEAFARIAPQFPDTSLAIAGKPGDYQPQLREQAEALGVGDRVEFLGIISEEDKRRRYRECIAYVQPTLYEGFGHAVGEAISCGAPVISAARGAVPEVAGPHAHCVDPKDVAAIADAMATCALSSPDDAQRQSAHDWIENNYSLAVRRKRLAEVIDSVARS